MRRIRASPKALIFAIIGSIVRQLTFSASTSTAKVFGACGAGARSSACSSGAREPERAAQDRAASAASLDLLRLVLLLGARLSSLLISWSRPLSAPERLSYTYRSA
eukprot:2366512-Prymnesium_polylepis.2